jgi:hypothetical protein
MFAHSASGIQYPASAPKPPVIFLRKLRGEVLGKMQIRSVRYLLARRSNAKDAQHIGRYSAETADATASDMGLRPGLEPITATTRLYREQATFPFETL